MIHCKIMKPVWYPKIDNLALTLIPNLKHTDFMEPNDQYNFSIFRPRNLHGRKNRNVILSMLAIWAIAVFGFQFRLRAIEKPVPEESLITFEAAWPKAVSGDLAGGEFTGLLRALVLTRGKNTVTVPDQTVLNNAISSLFFGAAPDSIKTMLAGRISEMKILKAQLSGAKDAEYLGLKSSISDRTAEITGLAGPVSGFVPGSLEMTILVSSLEVKYPPLLSDNSFTTLPAIMKLYLTHNRSKLTDATFLGFPFHYFYTAVFLLILFISLCIVYNLLIEWRLKKVGVVE